MPERSSIIRQTVDTYGSHRGGWTWRDSLLVILLFAFALGLRLWNIDQPQEQYFDEIYYVEAGLELWAGREDPNSVHPPLGKWCVAAGVKLAYLIGVESEFVASRLASALAGGAMVAALYAFALTLYPGNRLAAFAAAFILSTEHLHISMTRIAMLDPFLALFCLLGTWWSLAYFLGAHERWAVFASISLGLATACKWSGILTAFGCFLAGLYIDKRKNLSLGKSQRYFTWLLALTPLTFLASYAHLFRLKGLNSDTLFTIFNQAQRMVRFRYDPEQFVHGYKSYFYEWPLVLRPIWLHFKEESGKVEGLCSLGIWFVWWAFIVLLLERVCSQFSQPEEDGEGLLKSKGRLVAGGLVLIWLGQWAPWFFSKTGGFFYYMLPQVPIMALLGGKLFADLFSSDDHLARWRWLALVLAIIYLAGVLAYLPFAIGLKVSRSYFEALFFLPRWI